MRMAVSRGFGWAMVAASAKTPQSRDTSLKIVHEADADFANGIKHYEKTIGISPQQDRMLFDRAKDRYAEFRRQRMSYETLILGGDRDGTTAFLEQELVPSYMAAVQAAEDLLQYNHANSIAYAHQIRRSVDSLYWTVAVVTVLALICSAVFIVHFAARSRESKELRESEEKFSKAFRSSPIGIAISELDTGRFIEVNETFCQLYGYTPEEVVSRNAVELGILANAEERHRLFQPLFQSGSLRNLEMQTRSRDGRRKTVVFHAETMQLGDRKCVVSLVQDITEQKRADEALRESEARIRNAMDIAQLAHWEFDVERNLVTAEEHLFEMLGTNSTQEGGQSMPPEEYIRRFVHPSDAAIVANEVALGMATTNPDFARQFEHRVIRRNGTEGVMSIRCRVLMDEAGKPVKISGTNQDITEYRRREERFHRLFEADMHGVTFWNTRGSITEANDVFLKITGYDREDLAHGDIDWAAMTPPEYADLDKRALEEIAATGVCQAYEKEFFRQDGSRVPVLVGGAALGPRSDEGVSFVLDLTERKKLEQQFLRAQRMESIGTLAGGIAHDLNNVLGPIMMSIELLQMKFTDPSSRELLEMISSSAQHGADMVRQVLSFARGVAGRRMELQVKHLIKDTAKIATDTFLKGIVVRADVPEGLWTIVGDPTQLHQVLLNLCVNARDAMPNGGTLTLAAENLALDAHNAGVNPEAPPGQYVLLTIQDSGSGMSPEVVERIFDPFFTTKEVGKGTGLGLSTTMGIVKSHGGFIRVYSEPGAGTTFRVYLPAQSESSAGEAELEPELPRGRGELILVVDDEMVVREITRQTLESFGYRVLLAGDGAEAVSVYTEFGAKIAVVLTDMMMPVMDGAATIEVLRRMNPEVCIVAASGLTTQGRIAHATKLGVKHFLTKPFTTETLLKTLQEMISTKTPS
jgi:PAS domain S-box-containing protein